MKTETKIIIAMLAVFLAAPLVEADSYELYCLGPGELLDLPALCNPAMEARTGPINICMHNLDNGKICPASINKCNSLGLSCTGSGTNTTFDVTPPNMTIFSPIEGEVYTERGILLDVDPSEIASIDYQDKRDTRRWKRVCSRCSRYTRERNFDEGFNDLTFRVKDVAGNTAFYNLTFYVDSKDPRIRSTEPTKGFASSLFKITFQEDNPSELVVHYGNAGLGMQEHNIDIENECVQDRDYVCDTEIDLSPYDGQEVEYYVVLTDVAGNSDESTSRTLMVDNSAPVINSLDFAVDGKKVFFTIDITEPFLDEATYIDNSDKNPRERKLCSKLVNSICEKKVSFKDGNHNVTITVYDEAGNAAGQSVSFPTDSRKPKISKTEPKKGFASGDFYVEFQEENPDELTFTYGNSETGERQTTIDIKNDCNTIKGKSDKQACSVSVNLSDYDSQEIEYWFELRDVVGNEVESRVVRLDVDVTFPVVNSINYTIDRNRAEVVINVTETNFDEITYINNDDRRPREKRLCSRLRDGICKKRISLNDGLNRINFQVFDEAGNSVGENIEIFL